MKAISILIFLISLCFGIEGKVVKVSDGDTIHVLTDENKLIKVRLFGIDAPEKKQAYGQASRKYLSDLIAGKIVNVDIKSRDRYKRSIGIVYLDNKDINYEMVINGFAWAYSYYSDKYNLAQETAKNNKVGLWVDKAPISPYEFRKMRKKKKK